ncbi:MAG TPA: FMN-binding negative transcriptional regulator, partial [Candidatus Limnocylindria bacterium]|nr:FMN-binding negative transcriptional regulator [Candidatus Limnocylindria bacterium]
MLINKHDAAISEAEWKAFLAARDFGELIASGRGRDVPVVVPTHFIYDGDRTIRLHLAVPNPVWEALSENPLALVSVYGDYSYIPTQWNANPGAPIEYGIPTSYYAAVQAVVRTRNVDDPDELAEILRAQLA